MRQDIVMRIEQRLERLPVLVEAYQFFKTRKTDMARFGSAAAMFGWSMILFWPGTTLTANLNLEYLTKVIPSEIGWATVLLIVSVLTYLSARYQWHKAHAVVLLLTMAWYVWLTVAIILSCVVRDTAPSTGIAAYGVFSWLSIVAFLRFVSVHDVVRRRGE